MRDQQINLKWKSFHSTILASFESMWAEEGLVDVTLATEGRCLKAHKVILSASSPFFRSIFQMNPCQHPVIVFHDINYSELESILKFVYKGEVNIYQKNLPLLLRAAETLQIRGLCRQLEHEYNTREQEISEKQRCESHERLVSEKLSEEKTPPSSPKIVKKIKSNHSYKPQKSPLPLQRALPTEISVPVCPVVIDEMKYEPRPSSPVMSDEKGDNRAESSDASQPEIIDTDGDENDLSENTNDYAFDMDETSSNFPFPPFPCPFCDRAYTRWGFRRRHIKACHTRSKSLPCKWCLKVLPSHTEWESHVCLKHSLSRSDARNGLLILEEAEVVLQIPQPTRLDALVTMIKEHNSEQSEINPKVVDLEKEEEEVNEIESKKNVEKEKEKNSSQKWVDHFNLTSHPWKLWLSAKNLYDIVTVCEGGRLYDHDLEALIQGHGHTNCPLATEILSRDLTGDAVFGGDSLEKPRVSFVIESVLEENFHVCHSIVLNYFAKSQRRVTRCVLCNYKNHY